MIEPPVLEALDGLLWLRSAEQVALRFGSSEATISRYRNHCLKRCGLSIQRQQGEWELIGDTSLLLLERRVHQEARWRGHRPLRLEAPYWTAPLLQEPVLQGWILGGVNIVGVQRPFQLLEDRVIDALITGLPDLPTRCNPALVAIPLIHMPVFCVVAEGHPLLKRAQLSIDDIAMFPSLALPAGSYPKVEEALRSLGLWNDGVRMHRYNREQWEGRAEQELLVGYGTALSLEASGRNLRRLPLQLPFSSGDALVLRSEYAHHPLVQKLLQELQARYQPKLEQHPEIAFDAALLARLQA